MNGLRKALAGLLLVLTLPISLVTAWNYGIFSTYLNQNFYHASFFEETLYPALIHRITVEISGKINELGQYLSEEDVAAQLQILLPVAVIQDLIDNLFDQLGQETLPREVIISFEGIKKNLPEVVENITKLVQQKTGQAIPQAVLAREFETEVDRMLPDEFKILTDQLLQGFNAEQKNRIQSFHEKGLSALRWGLWITWGLLLTLIGLLIFSRTALRWWGITLTLDAMAILAISQILKEGLSQAIQETEWSEEAMLLQPIFKSISFLGFAVLAVGIALILSQYWLKPHTHEQ